MTGQKYAKIVIEPYTETWAECFDELHAVYAASLAGLYLDIQHVGSTSVPGLAAKPILDVDIIIDSLSVLPAITAGLEKLGYEHMGTMGIAGREAFSPSSDNVPPGIPFKRHMRHNLYVCQQGSVALQNHLLFRDYLKRHPEALMEYAALKRELVERDGCTLSEYATGKTDFITGILLKAGLGKDTVDHIAMQNK